MMRNSHSYDARMISQRLRELRLKNNLSMQEVAVELGVTRASVSKWEIGLTQPELARLERLAGLYGTSVGFILGESSGADVFSYPVVSEAEVTKLSSTSSTQLEFFPSTRRLEGVGFFVQVDNDVFVRAGLAEIVQGSKVLIDCDRAPKSGDICYLSVAKGHHLFAIHNLVAGRSFYNALTPEYTDLLKGKLKVIGVAIEAVTVTALTNVANRIRK